MSVTYGFYNSVAGDRLYDAVQMSKFLEGVISDGVMESIGNKLNVVQNSGMVVFVGSGKAWFNNTWTYNDSNEPLTVTSSHPTLNRIDSVVLEVDTSTGVRVNSFKIIAGTAASSPVRPTLTDTSTKFYHRLADIYVGAAVTQILTANITILVGGVDCPYCQSAMWETTNLQNQIDTVNTNLSDAQYQKRFIQAVVLDNNTALTVKDGAGDFLVYIPSELAGWKLTKVEMSVNTASSSGLPTLQLYKAGTGSTDLLSTKLTIDANEYSSTTAATPAVIDTSSSKNVMASGDKIRFDIDVAGTGTKGLIVNMTFTRPNG